DELPQFRKIDNLVEALLDLALAETQHDAVDEDVLPARDLRVKASTQFDQRRDASIYFDRARRRLRDTSNQLERGALARTISADHPVGRSLRHHEGHIGQGREGFARLEIPQDAALQQRALERRELPAAVAAVDLRDVGELDGVHDEKRSVLDG